jgi:methionyl-tRNA formyltransferase
MNLIFAGTPDFAASALEALLVAGRVVSLVLTQPDRPAGRGMKAIASPVKRLAQAHALPVLQPATLKDPVIQRTIAESGADAMVVAAYGLILPPAVLDMFPLGAINIHASLLPRWRGAAPIQRALLAGDQVTGVCIMRMDAGLDTGPVLMQESLAITTDETAQTLHDRLAGLGSRLIVQTLDLLESGPISARPQPNEGVTYAHKLNKAEARVDWWASAVSIERQIRAFCPHPGAQTVLRGTELKLFRAALREKLTLGGPKPQAGEIIAAGPAGLTVSCGQGQLELLELQRPGGKRLPASDFLRGFPILPGERFGSH